MDLLLIMVPEDELRSLRIPSPVEGTWRSTSCLIGRRSADLGLQMARPQHQSHRAPSCVSNIWQNWKPDPGQLFANRSSHVAKQVGIVPRGRGFKTSHASIDTCIREDDWCSITARLTPAARKLLNWIAARRPIKPPLGRIDNEPAELPTPQ